MKKLFLVLLVMPLYLLVTGFLPNCPPIDGPDEVYFPNESDCSKFYKCNNGNAILMTCAPGTLFDADRKICDFEDRVDCSQGGKVKLKIISCMCESGKVEKTVRCQIDGDRENCSTTIQGLSGCYKTNMFNNDDLLCEGT